SPRPYHCGIQATQSSPWASLSSLAHEIGDHDMIAWQCLFTPVQHDWHTNITAMLAMERSLRARSPYTTRSPKNSGEPLFASVIRIAATNASFTRGIAAYIGTFTADGIPFHWRTLDDYQRVLTPAQIAGMLATRTTHTTGQLFTLSELALFVHLPDRQA